MGRVAVTGYTDYFRMDLLGFKSMEVGNPAADIFTSTMGNVNTYTGFLALPVGVAAALFAVSTINAQVTAYVGYSSIKSSSTVRNVPGTATSTVNGFIIQGDYNISLSEEEKEAMKTDTNEVSDEELDVAAGGCCSSCNCSCACTIHG